MCKIFSKKCTNICIIQKKLYFRARFIFISWLPPSGDGGLPETGLYEPRWACTLMLLDTLILLYGLRGDNFALKLAHVQIFQYLCTRK